MGPGIVWRWGWVVTATRPDRWNFTPPLPLRSAPFLHWPVGLRATAAHLIRTWSPQTPRVFMLGVAFLVWRWLMPSMESAAQLSPGWLGATLIRNLVLLTIVAGGTHLWLYRFEGQGTALRYDSRPFPKNKRVFLSRDQVRDNVFLSVVSGVVVWTFAESLILHLAATGRISTYEMGEHPVWFVVVVALIPWWSVLFFSAHHRLLHTEFLYRRVHSWHHRNTNVGPWSGLAMHPVEHVVLFSDVALLLLVPFHPVHLYFMLLHHGLGAPLSHTGYDALTFGPLRIRVGDFHHQLHHRLVECNYGGLESPVDEMLGTFHDGTPDADARMRDRRRAGIASSSG